MEFPKKFTRSYKDDPPIIIIRGTGNHPNIRIVEYSLAKRKGSMCFYKRR
jgi:hypothetical protein